MKLIKIFILLAILCTLIGCGQRIAGTYVKENNPDEYIELRRDGSLIVRERGIEIVGKWEATRDGVRIIIPAMGMEIATSVKIEKNKIIDEEGGVWIKKRLKNHFRRTQ